MQRAALLIAVLLPACSPADPADGRPEGVTVDFAAPAFPALTRKVGFNSSWNSVDQSDLDADANADVMGAPIASGLIETKYGPQDFAGDPASVFQPDPLFYRDQAGALQTRAGANLATLRQHVTGGMLNFVQLAGTPCSTSLAACLAAKDLFTIDPAAQDTSGGAGDGNWYPLPVAAEVPDAARALASFAHTVAQDGVPTIWALWQEPDHTIDDKLSKEGSVAAYLPLYKSFARAVRAADPDAVVAGPQQNQATGTNHDHSIDGAGYNAFVHNQGAGVGDAEPVPLDYVTIQDYLGKDSTLETLQNTRVAYADPRFDRAPVMFNEWDVDKSKSNGFDTNYDTPAGLVTVLDQLQVMLDQPDLAYVMMMRALFTAEPVLAQAPIALLSKMPPHRRPVTFSSGRPSLRGIAGGDAEGAAVLIWNHAAEAQAIDLDLRDLPAALVSGRASLIVESVAEGGVKSVEERAVSAAEVRLDGLRVPASGLLMIRAGDGPPNRSGLVAAKYARHLQWVGRRGASSHEAPHGMGHFDVRSGSLVASVDGAGGVGLAGVVLRVPASYTLALRASSSGLPGPDAGAVLGVRVDYLKGEDSVAAVFHRDPRFTGAAPGATLVAGKAPVPQVRPLQLDEGKAIELRITDDAPPSWDAARRVLVSLLLVNPAGAATVEARLSDGP